MHEELQINLPYSPASGAQYAAFITTSCMYNSSGPVARAYEISPSPIQQHMFVVETITWLSTGTRHYRREPQMISVV